MNESDKPQDPIQHQVKLVEQLRDSEQEYGNELQILIEHYAEPLEAANGIITAEQHATIFGEIRSIAEFSVKFLSVLDRIVSNWEEYIPGKYGDELLDFIPYLQMHENYVNFEHTSMTLIDELENVNEPFRVFCETTTPRCNGRDLRTLLRLPLNRPKSFQGCFSSLLRYMDSIVSSSPRQSQISKASVGLFSDDLVKFRALMGAAEDTVSTIEERIEENAAMDELRQLESQIVDGVELASPHRRLIKRGKLRKIARKKMQSYEFFLLTDMLLYCRYARSKSKSSAHHGTPPPIASTTIGDTPHQESEIRLKLHNKLPIDRAFYTQDRDDIEKYPNTAFAIYSSVKSFLVCADTEKEKREWIECIEHTLAKQLRNKRSIAGSSREMTVPLFLPDDYTDVCMECGTQFNDKMNVRKKHCNHCGRLTCSNCTKNRLPHLKKVDLVVRVCNSCYAKNRSLFPDFPPLPPAVTPPPPDVSSDIPDQFPAVNTSSDGHLLHPGKQPQSHSWDSTTGYTSLEGDDSNDETIGNTPPPSSSLDSSPSKNGAHRVLPSDVGSDILNPLIDSSGNEHEDPREAEQKADESESDYGIDKNETLPSLIRRATDQAQKTRDDSFIDPSAIPQHGVFAEEDENDASDEGDMIIPVSYGSSGPDDETQAANRFHVVRHLSGHIDDQSLRQILANRVSDSDDDEVEPYVPDEYKATDDQFEQLRVDRGRGFTLNASDSDEEQQRLRKVMKEKRRKSSAKISRFLQDRPPPGLLIGKGVLVAMPFLDHHVRMAKKLESKQELTQKLSRRLSQKFRPSLQELEARGILPMGANMTERKSRIKTLKKRASASLEAKLSFRPGPGDIVASGLVPKKFVPNMLGVSAIGANVAQAMLYGSRNSAGNQSVTRLHPTVVNESTDNQIHTARTRRKKLLKRISDKRREVGERYESKFRDLQDEIAETRNKLNDLKRQNDQLQQRVETQTRLFRSITPSENPDKSNMTGLMRERVRSLELERQQIMDSKIVFLEMSAKQFNILRTGIRAYKHFSQSSENHGS